jgi:hypothetical protein
MLKILIVNIGTIQIGGGKSKLEGNFDKKVTVTGFSQNNCPICPKIISGYLISTTHLKFLKAFNRPCQFVCGIIYPKEGR